MHMTQSWGIHLAIMRHYPASIEPTAYQQAHTRMGWSIGRQCIGCAYPYSIGNSIDLQTQAEVVKHLSHWKRHPVHALHTRLQMAHASETAFSKGTIGGGQQYHAC